jgi:hypothetical protein
MEKAEMVLPRLLLLGLEEPFGTEQLKPPAELIELLVDLAARKARAQMAATASMFHGFTSLILEVSTVYRRSVKRLLHLLAVPKLLRF